MNTTVGDLRFLNQATVTIGASLDLAETAAALAAAVVPRLADRATVYLLEALFDPELTLALATELRQAASVPADSGSRPSPVIHRAMESGEPIALSSDEAVPGASLVVPIRVRGRILGAILLIRSPDRSGFDEIDVLMCTQLAAQAGLGVHNAYLYEAEALAADTLQRSMLPTHLPRFAGVDLTHRYLPASDTVRVGGDWFDAIALPGSRVAFVVGDVMGHGLSSAAIMGQLRTAVQTLAALDLPPDQVLRHLDDLAQGLGDTYLATCVYVVYDPVARRCTIANAGHLPPVLVHADGQNELLQVPEGVPIGVGGIAFESVEISVADGDRLVLCTDGLVEVRGEDITAGLATLRANLAVPGLSLDAQCEVLLRVLHCSERQDDVALLVADLHGIPAGDVAHWLLEPRRTTPARIRRLIRATMGAWGLSAESDVTELLATELVTNAVRYATRPIELRLLRTDALLCEVSDDEFRLPILRHAADTDEGGRGLQLVSRLSRRWGASRTTSGKVVWFEQTI
ncbi:MAG: SpoIIE family protein phosphatase [Streptosporangiaceae bacterium]